MRFILVLHAQFANYYYIVSIVRVQKSLTHVSFTHSSELHTFGHSQSPKISMTLAADILKTGPVHCKCIVHCKFAVITLLWIYSGISRSPLSGEKKKKLPICCDVMKLSINILYASSGCHIMNNIYYERS